MAFELVPWAVNGAEVTADMARLFAYASTGSAEGVVEPTSLRVQALATPGTSVRIFPGAGIIRSKYPGVAQQSYVLRNKAETLVPITATGSSGARSDLLVARIVDPQFEGQAPEDPDKFQYSRPEVIEGVPSNTLSAKQLNLKYPAIALARIDIPASTGTITNAMITDLREVAIPRTRERVFPRPAVMGDGGLVLNSRDAHPRGEWFPNYGGQDNNGAYYVDVPEWATRMQIRMEWLAVRYNPNAGYGYCWVTYGPGSGSTSPQYSTQAFQWDASQSNQTQRQNWVVHDERYVPPEMRGTRTAFVGRANKTSPNNASYNGTVELTPTSGMVFSVKFMEQADNEIA